MKKKLLPFLIAKLACLWKKATRRADWFVQPVLAGLPGSRVQPPVARLT